MPRRAPRYSAPSRRAGSVLLGAGASPARRRRSRGPAVLLILILALLAGGAYLFLSQRAKAEDRVDAAQAFARAWAKRDLRAMHALTGGGNRPRLDAFERSYGRADEAAGTEKVVIGKLPEKLEDGALRVPVTIRTDIFGPLKGTMALPTVHEGGEGRVDWAPELRLPGLREGETPERRTGRAPTRGEVLAADGSRLADDVIGSGIAGEPDGPEGATGLERIYDDRLGGHPSATLLFGKRVIRRVKARKGRDVHSTVQLGLTRVAQSALGSRLGGVAVVRPRDGAVLALGGLAVSAPQAPGSTFKIITLAGALQAGVTDPSDSFPVQSSTRLSGVEVHNAGDEACGGSLANSFAHSCNTVFAPLGAKLGAKRLVRISERFGFNATPNVPAAKPSTIARDLKDDLAVGAAAIGQDRDLATPLQMASVGATIANRGVRVAPRVVREEPRRRRRVVSRRVASTVRDMMIGVVRGGTGVAAALPGVTVAGKTGTAELVPTHGGPQDPENTNAWFVAFAPAEAPRVAVAVMLVGAGQGGATAAPIARQVLSAAL